MRSTITLTINHGDDTDDVQEFVEAVTERNWLGQFFDFTVTNVDFNVDTQPVLTPQDALTELIDMGVDEKRILECPVGKLSDLYYTVMDESTAMLSD